jgi:16S rRNA (adenine(1408)-N(1))-methyltransferase
VLDRAWRDPRAFVIGLDANAPAMAEASARAARRPAKGGLPNALFAVAAAERPPEELVGRIDELTIRFPWGSLLRGALALDDDAAAGLTALLSPNGRIEALLSVTSRDAQGSAVPPITATDRTGLATRWRAHGVCVDAFRPATAEEVATACSTWARRLTAGGRALDRDVWRLELRRDPGPADR